MLLRGRFEVEYVGSASLSAVIAFLPRARAIDDATLYDTPPGTLRTGTSTLSSVGGRGHRSRWSVPQATIPQFMRLLDAWIDRYSASC